MTAGAKVTAFTVVMLLVAAALVAVKTKPAAQVGRS